MKTPTLLAGAAALAVATAFVAPSSAWALCPSPTVICDDGTVVFISANNNGYKIQVAESQQYYAIQYSVLPAGVPSEAAVAGFVNNLRNGDQRTIITDGTFVPFSSTSDPHKYLNITGVRNISQ